MVVDKILERVGKDRKIYPQHANRASAIGFPCLRNCCYQRISWSDRKLPDIGLQLIFNEGSNQERLIKRSITDAGFDVLRAEENIWMEKYKLSGHIDGIIVIDEENVLIEIKSMNDNLFNALNSLEDLITSTKIWHRNYYVQIQIYIYATGCKRGLFIIKAKSLGQLKEFEVPLNVPFCEKTFERCTEVNRIVDSVQNMLTEVYQIEEIADLEKREDIEDYLAIKNEAYQHIDKLLPARVNDMEICDFCDFNHICLPDEIREQQIKLYVQSEGFINKLDRREEIKQFRSEYNSIDKDIKSWLKQIPESTFYIGTDDMKMRYQVSKGKQIKIERLEE